MAGNLPENFGEIAAKIASDAHDAGATVASRKASQLALEGLTAALLTAGWLCRPDRLQPHQHQVHSRVPRG